MKNKVIFLLTLLFAFTVQAQDTVKLNGYGSIVMGTVIDGPGYIAEYPNLGTYDGSEVLFSPESRLGIQLHSSINDKASFTTQLMFRGANGFDPEIAWAYLTYQFKNETTLQAGRLRVPVYHFSEFMDVGYAYTWLRIPSDAYSLDLINYNGARLSKSFYVGQSTINATILYGHQTNENDELMSYLFPEQIDRQFDNIMGLVFDWERDALNFRASYVKADMKETRHLSYFLASDIFGIPDSALVNSSTAMVDSSGEPLVSFVTGFDISFIDLSFKWSPEQWTLFAEYNEYDPFYSSYFVSVAYQFEEFQPYIMYSQFDLNETWESHDTIAIGLRYDFATNMALKFDISNFSDTGYNPFSGESNPVYQPARTANGGDGKGDATVLSLAIDFVF